MRLRWLSLALLLLALPAHAFDFQFRSGTEATDSVAHGLQRGATGYASVTSSGIGMIGVAQCSKPVASVVCNTSSGSDHDCSVVFWRCPSVPSPDTALDTAAELALLCRVDKYQDANGTWQSEVNGDVDAVRDLNEIDPTPNLVAVVTTVSQTTRVQVDCR